jgi:hypothetical protein
MQQNLFDEIRRLRNESVHGLRAHTPAELAKRFSEIGLSILPADLPEFMDHLLRGFGRDAGLYYVPHFILGVIARLLDGKSAHTVCDPWPGMGTVLASVSEATQATHALAFTNNRNEAELGRVLLSSADWRVGDPHQLLSSLPESLDVVASVLPCGTRGSNPLVVQTADGTTLTLQDDLGNLILVASSMKLSPDGLGLFVVPQSFFFSQRSVLRQFDALGLRISAALALPSGAFAPYATISTYLVVVEKGPSSRTFVAQLFADAKTDQQVIQNFRTGKEAASLDLGRMVDISTFSGMDALRTSEQLEHAERQFGFPSVSLGDLAAAVTLGRFGEDFAFPERENVIFVPLIGNSDVVDSMEHSTLKPQNYAQVEVDSTRSDARFVARFLNSEFGKDIRELNKSGFIPKLNRQSLMAVRVFIPDLQTQREMLAMEARMVAEENTLLGLQNEIAECRRELWAKPHSRQLVSRRLDDLSSRLSVELKQQTEESLDQWFESLPFPLASIARVWQATSSEDFEQKYQLLLRFFDASAEFAGTILLSAFKSREQLFEEIKNDLTEALRNGRVSFEMSTCGTWKVVVEYLGKRVRQLLSGDKDQQAICADMFADPSKQLPYVLSRKELAGIVSATTTMRNDWKGHGGLVGQEEARRRNERLLTEVQKLREATGDLWSNVQLVHASHCRRRRDSYENEVAVLMSSHSEFLPDTIELPTGLDVERLYIVRKDSGRALELLPLVKVGPSPPSAQNACYFFSNIDKNGLHYVTHHFTDQSERTYPIEDALDILALLQGNGGQ